MKLKSENVLLKNFKTLVVLGFAVTINYLNAQNPTWQWAKSIGGVGNDFASKTCVDASGNVFVACNFQSSSINVGTVNIANSGISGMDVFVAKFNPSGDVIWAQRIAGANNEYATGITVDAAGRVYVSGYYSSPQISIPPFLANNTGSTSVTNDIYIACLNGSGVPQFLNSYGSTSHETAGGLAYYGGSTQAIYLTGSYTSSSFQVGATTLTNTGTGGSSEGYLIKFNTTGTPQWARTFGSAGSGDYSNSVEVDNTGAPHILGSFGSGNTVIGTSTLVSYGSSDIFFAKYDVNGNFVWSKNIGGTSNDFPGYIDIDATNNIYISGYYQNTSINFGSFSLPNAGGYDAFAAKFNSLGTNLWATRAYGTGNEYGMSLVLDAVGNTYLSGYTEGASFTIGSSSFSNLNAPTSDMFIAKLNTAGTFQWLAKSTGTNSELTLGGAMAIDAVGNIYTTGIYDGNATFSTTSFNAAGAYDIFFAKIGCLTTGLIAPVTLCTGTSATLSATEATTYSWSTGATSSSIVVSPTATTVYSVTGTTGSCVGTPASYTLNVLPASLTLGSNLNLTCKQKAPFSVAVAPSATSVTWSPATNLSSSSVLTPTVTGASGTTIYTINVSLNNGCVKTGTISATTTAPTPSICMVTVDSLSNYNEVYWDKTLFPKADSFIVYRETSSNIYTRIGGVSRTALSMYIDTNRSIGPANGNPNLTFYRYKLAIKDSCGNISNKSLYHETIFNQDQQNGNFNWNSYSIESSTTPISIYNLKRRNLTTGTETLVASTTGNLTTDPSYNTFWPTQTKWFVDAVGFNCNATTKVMVLKTKTKSNQSNDKQFVTNIGSLAFDKLIEVYPNPAKDNLNVDFSGLPKIETIIELTNMLGQVIHKIQALNQVVNINTSTYEAGVYMLTIKQNNTVTAVKKVVIE